MCAWAFDLSGAEIRKALIKCGPIYPGAEAPSFLGNGGRPEGRPFQSALSKRT